MAWHEFRATKSGTARRLNKKTGKWETGSYYVREKVAGKKSSKPAGSMMKTVNAMEREMETRRAKSWHGMVESPAIKAAYTEYEITIKKDTRKSPRTWGAYSWGIEKFLTFLENTDRSVDSIRPEEVIRFRTRIMQAHKINGMLDILKCLRTFFSFCVKSGYAQINPVAGALGDYSEEKIATYYKEEHIRLFMAACTSKARGAHRDSAEEFGDIMTIALTSGFREAEIAGLECEKLQKPHVEVLGKGRKIRSVPIMDERAWVILEKYKARGHKHVFHGWNPDRIKQYWKRLLRNARKLGQLPKRCRFHDFRHTFASNFLMSSGRLEDLQELLGHSSSQTTERYKHIQKSHLEKEMLKMKNAFLDAVPAKFHVT